MVVVDALGGFDDFSAQQMDVILNAIRMNTMRMVITMPMKYGVEESGEVATTKFSVEKCKTQ